MVVTGIRDEENCEKNADFGSVENTPLSIIVFPSYSSTEGSPSTMNEKAALSPPLDVEPNSFFNKESSTVASSSTAMTVEVNQELHGVSSTDDYYDTHPMSPIMPQDLTRSPPEQSTANTSLSIHKSRLRLLPLAILVFYNVSGGPFGIEPSLHSAGNFYTIIGYLVVPFIWSVPEALITAELGSIFCHDGSGGVGKSRLFFYKS